MPQLEVIASYGTALLDWLETYTFPAELRYADPRSAPRARSRFLDALLAHGTTSAVVFPTVHKASAEALFAAAEAARHARHRRQVPDGPARAGGADRHAATAPSATASS